MNESAPSNPACSAPRCPIYARYRLGYPDSFVQRVIDLAGLQWRDPVLDLGCGPGLLALPFAQAEMRGAAVDPEPDDAGRRKKRPRRRWLMVDIRQGSSFDMQAARAASSW